MNSEYLKNCPHCKKDFHARRLNQVYCTYSCKVKFNNEKTRLKRLNLLEIEKRYLASDKEILQKKLKAQEPPTILNHSHSISDVKKLSPFHLENKIFIGLGIAAVGTMVYFIYQNGNSKNKKLMAKDFLVKNQFEILATQIEQNKNLQSPPPIPTEISLKKKMNPSTENSASPKNIEDEEKAKLTQNLQAKHPDIKANKRILKNQNII